jgi:hypothetical protein
MQFPAAMATGFRIPADKRIAIVADLLVVFVAGTLAKGVREWATETAGLSDSE